MRLRINKHYSWAACFTGVFITAAYSSGPVVLIHVESRPTSSQGQRSSLNRTRSGSRAHTSASAPMAGDLRAARAESWPWKAQSTTDSTTKSTMESTIENEETKTSPELGGDKYINVLQSACQRGFQAPPRHEVEEYQKKPLPPLPPPVLPVLALKTVRDSLVPASVPQPTLPSVRVSMVVNPAFDPEEEHIYRNELISPELKWQTRNHIVSHRQSTWVSRVERRALTDQIGRKMLHKKQE